MAYIVQSYGLHCTDQWLTLYRAMANIVQTNTLCRALAYIVKRYGLHCIEQWLTLYRPMAYTV